MFWIGIFVYFFRVCLVHSGWCWVLFLSITMTSRFVLSRELVQIVREASDAEPGSPVSVHLASIESKKARDVEVFLRVCALRLGYEQRIGL